MNINLIADGSVGSAPSGFTAAVQAAANVFDQDIPGNYTVNITYGWGTYDNASNSDLTPSSNDFSIGGPDLEYSLPYATIKKLLTNSATTSEQIVALSSLPATSPFSNNIAVSSAQEKALGVFSGSASAVDGSIGFNTADVQNGVLSPYTQEAALTEIMHALGLLSGLGTSNYAYILDLDRYSAPGSYYANNAQGSYFSIDDGRTNLASYSTGGVDPTLFQNVANDPLSIPLSDGGAQKSLTELDLTSLDVMGFAGNSNLFGALTHDPTSVAGQIDELYQTVLGRAADPSGLANYVGQASSGTSLTSIAQSMLGSAEYANDTGSSTQSDSGFVNQLYVDGLHRQADPGGLQTYENALAGGTSRAQVAIAIATSSESRNDLAATFQAGLTVPSANDAAIAQLYYGLLDRAPDAPGLASFEVDENQGRALSDIAATFINSPEYAGLHGGQTNAQFVTALYQGALGRQPDLGGAAYWTNNLNGGASRASVAIGIADSPEANAHLTPLLQANYNLA